MTDPHCPQCANVTPLKRGLLGWWCDQCGYTLLVDTPHVSPDKDSGGLATGEKDSDGDRVVSD